MTLLGIISRNSIFRFQNICVLYRNAMDTLREILRALLKTFCAGSASNEPPSHPQPHQVEQQHRPPQEQQHGNQQFLHTQQGQQHRPNHQHGPHQYPPHTDGHVALNDAPYAPSSPSHKPAHRPRVDQNQINQNDGNYMALRAQANEEGDKMARCFDESHQAYERGDGALAKQLSDEGKAHKAGMERINKQASNWIFVENNKDSKPGEIDLHGLYVKEAIEHTDEAIQAARQRGETELHLIVGKGLHSPNHVAKLKPAMEDLMQKHQFVAELDPHNSGILIVYLGDRARDRGCTIDPDEITRRLEGPNRDKDCVIM